MRTETGQFLGARSIPIHWQAWLPDASPKAVVVVAHGFGEHMGRYTNLVDALVPAGYAIYGPDHRGHGRSGGHRALIDSFDALLDDLDAVFALAKHQHPEVPVALLGHSMGGSIALASALRNQSRLRGLILSGPAVAPIGVPKPLLLLAEVLGRVAPKLGAQKLDPAGVSRDPDVVAAYVADPLVFHGSMPAGTGRAILAKAKGYPDQLPSLRVPLLVVHGGADALVSVEAGRAVHRLAGSADKTLKVYDALAHEVINEPEKATVLADIVGWLDAHC